MSKTWNIAIIERNYIYREGLKRIFGKSAFRVAIECDSLCDAWESVETGSDLSAILIDLNDDTQTLKEDIARIRAAVPETRIVLMTESAGDLDLAGAVDSDLDGLILKSIRGEVIVKSLELILLGERVFPAEALQALWRLPDAQGGVRPQSSPVIKNLSTREIEVLQSLCEGNANKVIARELGISEATVKVHVKAILRKTHARNRTEAALWAKGAGIESHAV